MKARGDGRRRPGRTAGRRDPIRTRRPGGPPLAVAALVALAALLAPAASSPACAQGWPSDRWLEEPVDEETFDAYRAFFTYDRELPFDRKVVGREEQDGVVRERFSYVSTPGERVPALLFHPTAPGWERRPAAVLLHGGIGEGKDARVTTVLAEDLVRGGFNVLAFDLKYFGERATDRLTSYSEEEKHDRLYDRPALYLSWVVQTVKDAGRARDLLVEELGAEPERVALVGFSRGGQVGLIAGGADDRFRAVAILYGGHFDRLEDTHLAPACPANFIGRISPRPLLLVNGRFDQDYDRERSVEPLHRLAREPVEIRWLETGHAMPAPEERRAVASWLRERVAKGGS